MRYSDDPVAYFKAYRQLPVTKEKSRKRTAKRNLELRKSPAYRAANAAYLREWRKRNPNYMATYRQDNADKLKVKQRKRTLKKYDGMTEEAFHLMEREQGGCCAICESPPGGRWKRLFVDHDHETGKVRGLLCHLCNTTLGRVDSYRDKIDLYLERAK